MSGPIPTKLQRETFHLSRALEFFSEKELTAQMGLGMADWPVALLKELLDNALDACESAGVPPVVTVNLDDDALTIIDNGPGLPLDVLRDSLDYTIRVSDKTGYVSPSRGQQGNALKTLWAAPFVATGEGRIDVQTSEYSVQVRVSLDRIAQSPRLELLNTDGDDVKTGTKITLHWTGIASYLKRADAANFYSVLSGLINFNPHCVLQAGNTVFRPIDPQWTHWLPSQPTSPHWYKSENFSNLIALLINAERSGCKARSVNEFIREFHGLTSTVKAKAIAQKTGLSGAMLRDLITDDGQSIDPSKMRSLLAAMKADARHVKADAMGSLGAEHCQKQLIDYGVAADSVEYRKATGEVDGLPYVVEVAFGVKNHQRHGQGRLLSVGINFSPTLSQPFHDLDDALTFARCTRHDPIALLVHIVCPAVPFTDRGKSRAILPYRIADDLQRLVKLTTARFTKAKRQADRNDRIREREMEELLNTHKVKPMTVKDAAYQVMEQAYLKASSGGSLPANARQIMYAARPLIIELTGKTSPWKHSNTFTQDYLINFMREYPDICSAWDVVFDARGHFTEPHTSKTIGIGTIAVRNYVNDWHDVINQEINNATISDYLITNGPALRFRYALFIEKEGFVPLLEKVDIQRRYDLAVMSTKGMSVTAARQLVENLSMAGVTILVLHDFDKSGFTILHTLCHDSHRHQFKTKPNVVELGLRLSDIEAMNLESEAVEYSNDPHPGLKKDGATDKEIAFLVSGKTDNEQWIGKRVELNAMDSDRFVKWLEGKLKACGVGKFIPDQEALNAAWSRACRIAALNKVIKSVMDDTKNLPTPDPPDDLLKQVTELLAKDDNRSWDSVLADVTAKVAAELDLLSASEESNEIKSPTETVGH